MVDVKKMRAECSALEVKPKTGSVKDLPLPARCRIAREHQWYRFCKWFYETTLMIVISVGIVLVMGGFLSA